MRPTYHDGIAFYEGRPAQYETLGRIDTEIGGIIFSHSQSKTLKDVKEAMARSARGMGGNCIIDFKYGQKSVGWLRSLVQLDDVNWYGSGTVALLREP